MNNEKLVERLGVTLQIEMEKHRPDNERFCCTCGFCVWSAEHAMLMSLPVVRPILDKAMAAMREEITQKMEQMESLCGTAAAREHAAMVRTLRPDLDATLERIRDEARLEEHLLVCPVHSCAARREKLGAEMISHFDRANPCERRAALRQKAGK